MSKIYANDLTPGKASHPGEVIREEIKARGIQQQELAKQMGIAKTVISEIINGKRNLTPTLSLNLERVLGINAEFWMNFQMQYEIDLIRIKYRNQKAQKKKSTRKTVYA
jgi:addiction module HigA family antidote